MPDEYSAVVGPGKLKLKGVQDGRIEKKKKKKKKKEGEEAGDGEEARQRSATRSEEPEREQQQQREKSAGAGSNDESGSARETSQEPVAYYKTEAERRYEEARRQRVCLCSLVLFCLRYGLMSRGV